MAKSNEIEAPNINILSTGTTIKGDIKSNGDIRIDGTLIGSVNSKGKVVIGSTGNIEGEIICQNADFSGLIKAKIIVTELLQLKSTAKISGDIITNKLSIEPGAKFSGSCNMDSGATTFQGVSQKDTVKDNLRDPSKELGKEQFRDQKIFDRNEPQKPKQPPA